MHSPVDSSSFGSSAALPFPDKLSNTRGLDRGQIDQDRKDGRAIQKVQGPVSAAGTAPHKGSVRGRGTYGSSAPRGHGAVAGISPLCECSSAFMFLFVFLHVFRYTMLRRLPHAMPARPLLIAGTHRYVLESSCWIRLCRLSLVLRLWVVRFGGVCARSIC